MADKNRIVVYPANALGLMMGFLDSQIFVDPVVHLGTLDTEGKVRKGIFGRGKRVEGDMTGDLGLKPGKRVLFRRER